MRKASMKAKLPWLYFSKSTLTSRPIPTVPKRDPNSNRGSCFPNIRTLQQLLKSPVLQISRYVTTLQELTLTTWKQHSDYGELKGILENFVHISDSLAEIKRDGMVRDSLEADNRVRRLKLERDLENTSWLVKNNIKLSGPEETLVSQGQFLGFVDDKKADPVSLYLFE